MTDGWEGPSPAFGYSYCVSGRAMAVCKRCGAIVCNDEPAFKAHDGFHADLSRAMMGLPRPLGGDGD